MKCPDCGRTDCPTMSTTGERISDDPRAYVNCAHRQLDEERSKIATREHIDLVRNLLNQLCGDLLRRGEEHDQSKLSPEELPVFSEYSKRLKGMTYGSAEYQGCLAAMKPALEHHYQRNRHHPEHFPDGINQMNLIDLLEMMADWYASTKRHDDGNIYRSLEINRERFNISPQLEAILRNTIPLLER